MHGAGPRLTAVAATVTVRCRCRVAAADMPAQKDAFGTMDMTRLDVEELYRWLRSGLGMLDLGGGRIRPNYLVAVERAVPTSRDYFHVGTAECPVLTIDSIEATALDDLAEFLDEHGEARACLDRVDELLLQDANISDGGIATSVAAAMTALTAAPIAVLTASFPRFGLPVWPSSILAPATFKTRALPENQIVFVHPCRPTSYIVQPIADIVQQGPVATLCVKAAVYRLRRHQKVLMTRFLIDEE
jgi:hypothetical protein